MSRFSLFVHKNFVMLASLSCVFASFGSQADTILDQLCSKRAIAATKPHAKFNAGQCKITQQPLRTDKGQEGDNGNCEALLNVAHELKMPEPLALLTQKVRCDRGTFEDVFGEYAKSQTKLAGRVFGGVTGALSSQSLQATNAALREIVTAVTNGRLVAVSLDPKPIHDHYAEIHKVSLEDHGLTGAHTLLVRAVVRNKLGDVSHFVVVDSLGYEAQYAVPYEVFEKAYASLRTVASRGVYISKATRPKKK